MKRTIKLPCHAHELRDGIALGFSGNSKQRKKKMRALRRLGLVVYTPSICLINTPSGKVPISGKEQLGVGVRFVCTLDSESIV